jgi:mannose-6-phosphate isomerase
MLVPLSNEPRDYAWGSTSLIAELQGRAPHGGPEAEVWFGDHAGDPAVVGDGTGRTLDRWLADEAEKTDGAARLPYLLKLLAAAHPLSIQAHPSRPQAEAGFAREDAAGLPRDAAERNYRDDNHKPELVVAISEDFRALAGLRAPAASVRLLSALGEAPGVRLLRDRVDGADAEGVAALVPWLLSGDAGARSVVEDVTTALGVASSSEFEEVLADLRWLAAEAPGDAGIAVAVLMNVVTLRRGEGLFVPAGVLHAYFRGLGVEIMAASDNVLRGGFTPKHVDVDELAAVLADVAGDVPVVLPVPVPGAAGDVGAYPVPVDDFELARVRVTPAAPGGMPLRGIAIALCTVGAVTVEQAGGRQDLRPGEALLATPADGVVRITGDGEVFLAQPGSPASVSVP